MKKTDKGKISYPKGLSLPDRRHCRRIITAVSELLDCDYVIVSCSGGIDSTVLVHALGQALIINPWPRPRSVLDPLEETEENKIKATAVYLNHHFRPDQVAQEAEHVEKITSQYLTYVTPSIDLDVSKGPGLQERARDARYQALDALIGKIPGPKTKRVHVMTGHNQNDVAETKLFQFLKGRAVNGIPKERSFGSSHCSFLLRPLLDFSRKDIERYATAFNLTWCEDSSNDSDDYTRNKIRHHLIPWIEQNLNPGIVQTLSQSN